MGWTGMRLAAGVLATAVAFGPLQARAAGCGGAQTQADMNTCADSAFQSADAALNATYDSLVKEPSVADQLDKLRAAERAWVAYRTAQCAFEGARVEGGSMQPMVVQGCAEGLTKRRTAELASALACARDASRC